MLGKSVWSLGAAAIALSACASMEITQPPVPYQATKSLKAVGESSLSVRSFAKVSGETKELAGVPCKLTADGFKSQFQTPANVIVPNLQSAMPVAALNCTYEGKTVSKTLNPTNETISQIMDRNQSATAGNGVLGALIGGVIASRQIARRDETKDIYSYPDVRVDFE